VLLTMCDAEGDGHHCEQCKGSGYGVALHSVLDTAGLVIVPRECRCGREDCLLLEFTVRLTH
jgi:hypothetical protein